MPFKHIKCNIAAVHIFMVPIFNCYWSDKGTAKSTNKKKYFLTNGKKPTVS